jgi:zinc transporter ZupT
MSEDLGLDHKASADAKETTKEDAPENQGKDAADKFAAGKALNFYTNVGLFVVAAVTALTWLLVQNSDGSNNYLFVWSYSWMTAVCTGIGAVPFFLVDDVSQFWFGICNATAGGMMIAASAILAWESLSATDDMKLVKLVIGGVVGVIFVRVSRSKLEQYENLKLGGIEGLNARKAVLLMAVMTIHSLSEGIGIGVAFSGSAGQRLGTMISSSLAIHNIPEGLAVALVLVPKGVSPKGALFWSICSSIPQPLLAVPTFAFVAQFLYFLPLGLGFAAGAMVEVALTELLPEALEMTGSTCTTYCVCALAGGVMIGFQLLFI